MRIRRSTVLLLICAATPIFCLTGCGSSRRSTPPTITVAITTAPPATLQAGTQTSVAATVTNDSSNAGVNWSVTCGSAGACGSFSPTHTASGGATTYTAPAAVPTAIR